MTDKPPRRKRVEEFVPTIEPLLTPGVMPTGKGWKRNDGFPPRTKKRVAVKLRRGSICGLEPVVKDGKLGWDVATTRWTLTGSDFDVEFYRIL